MWSNVLFLLYIKVTSWVKKYKLLASLNSVQFNHSVMSDSLWPHRLQHARLPCLSPTPEVCSDSCPLSQWGHPTISSFVVPFSSSLQSFPASGSFPMSQLFASGGQSIGSFNFSINPSNEYSGLISFRMEWLELLLWNCGVKVYVLEYDIYLSFSDLLHSNRF